MKKTYLMSAAILGAAIQADIAVAQDDEEFELAQIDEITVYATRNPIPAFDYPGQVTVIGEDIIDDINPSTIADIFTAVPGASIGGGPRRTGQTPDIRGLSGEGVLVLFDGARQSFLSGHDGRFFIDPDLLRAVEVVRGPGSALYGSGALGGVVAMRTITASDLLEDGETAGFKVGSGYQSVNDEFRVSGTGVWRSNDNRFDVVGNLTFRLSEDIELGSGVTLPADDEVVSSLLKTSFRPNEDWELSASWIRFGGDSIDPNNPQGNNIGGPGNDNVFRNIDTNTFQGTVNYNPADSDLIDANLVAYLTKNEVEEAEVNTTRIVSREVETFGVSLDNRSRFDLGPAALTLTYGGEFYRDQQAGFDNTTPDGTRGGVPNATAKFYGAFVQGELAVDSPLGAPGVLTLLPGVRWDKFQTSASSGPNTDDEALSPKVGVSYKPIDALIIFGNWSEAYRAPSFNEIYADNVHFQIPNFSSPSFELVTNFFIPNPDLVPEESQTWEVGAGLDFENLFSNGDSFTIKGSYFKSDVTNLIDLEVNIPAGCFGAPFPPCGTGEAFGNFSRNVNVTNAELDGVEIEANYDSRFAYLRGNFSTIDGRDMDSGDFVGILTPDIYYIDGGVKFAGGDMRLGGRLSLASTFDKVNDPNDIRDSYAVGDIYAVWEPSSGGLKGIRVDLGVDNITDTDYQIVAAGVSEPGRNYKIAVSWRQGF
ncbi:TonB-dependent receptor domain-containing protein [Hyphococcus sp. DH-69]|uniref:TonB-dependent receptor domain-containing protein n=1 Tax=Hyphococcus formosus TaxID=3143534 RepID=UPI00398A5704